MCFSPLFEHFCILLRISSLQVKDGRATSGFSSGLSVECRLWSATQRCRSSMWATAHLLRGCSSLPPGSRERSYSSCADEVNAQHHNWALELLAAARSALNVVWESQFLLLCHRKLSNRNVHLEYGLASRCGCRLQSAQGSPCFLSKQQRRSWSYSWGDLFCLL